MNLRWLRQTFSILRKELLDSVRDRRSLSSGLLYSLFGPLLVALLLGALAKSFGGDRPLEITVIGAERAPNLIAFLEQREVKIHPTSGDAQETLRRGKDPVVLEIAEGYGDDFEELRPAGLRLVHDSSTPASGRAMARFARCPRSLRPRYRALASSWPAASTR